MKFKLVSNLIVSALLVVGSATLFANQQQISDNYNNELSRLNQQVISLQRIAFDRPISWVHQERLANVLLERARLTGKTDDYLEAQSVIKRAFEIADGKGGPFLTRAALNFSMHRLPEIEADLVAAESALLVDKGTKGVIAELRADVMFNSGEYKQAKESYDKSELTKPSTNTAIKLAFYSIATAQYDVAESWFVKAEERSENGSEQLRAWLKLQRGILNLEQGRYKEAQRFYAKAQSIFPGHWLIEEHIAEIDVLLGNNKKSKQSYLDLIKRTNSPLFMDALASILYKQDSARENAEAKMWMQRANSGFKLAMTFAPELISGHALDFFLQSDDELQLALTLAKQNYQLRPAGPAAVTLAQAYALHGQYSHALDLLEGVLAGPFRSPTLHATAYAIYHQLDQTLEADKQMVLAKNLNPVAIDDIDWLNDRLKSTASN